MAPPAPVSARALGRATLARQGLLKPIRSSPAAAVERLGSLQAQHPEFAGTWDLARRDGDASIKLRPIRRLPPAIRDALEEEAGRILALIAPDAMERSVSLRAAPK